MIIRKLEKLNPAKHTMLWFLLGWKPAKSIFTYSKHLRFVDVQPAKLPGLERA